MINNRKAAWKLLVSLAAVAGLSGCGSASGVVSDYAMPEPDIADMPPVLIPPVELMAIVPDGLQWPHYLMPIPEAPDTFFCNIGFDMIRAKDPLDGRHWVLHGVSKPVTWSPIDSIVSFYQDKPVETTTYYYFVFHDERSDTGN